MPVSSIHSFLVQPAKGEDPQPEISGTPVRLGGQIFSMLEQVFLRAAVECDVEIVFQPDEEGQQRNEAHDLLMAFARNPGMPTGREIAVRLQAITTRRSGLGLLFLILGQSDDGAHQLVISRFPADQGVMAQEDHGALSVEFIERVFMKNSRAYKSAFFATPALDAGFPDGRAVDRQLSGLHREVSEYWIRDFLRSELRTTGRAGTRRLAQALTLAIRKLDDLDVKQELVSAVHLMRNQAGRVRSARDIMRRLDLSPAAIAAVEAAFPRPELLVEPFRFTLDEFDAYAAYRSVELDNGAVLTARESEFEEVFDRRLAAAENQVTFFTTGRIVDERLKKGK